MSLALHHNPHCASFGPSCCVEPPSGWDLVERVDGQWVMVSRRRREGGRRTTRLADIASLGEIVRLAHGGFRVTGMCASKDLQAAVGLADARTSLAALVAQLAFSSCVAQERKWLLSIDLEVVGSEPFHEYRRNADSRIW
jgi:hypothetical protein